MRDPLLVALSIQIETVKNRLAEMHEPRERRILLKEMRNLLAEADAVMDKYERDLPKERP
jgi:hypothetical protein